MTHSVNFLAADLGASSGRVMAGKWDGRVFSLQPLHRFSNSGVLAAGTLYWDALGIWSQIQEGIAKYRTEFSYLPQGIGVDAWGVDFALLDRGGQLIGNPVHYRDSRTDEVPAKAFQFVDERELFAQTGVQTSQINTLFQLYSMAIAGDPKLQCAQTLLMIPDLFLYFLSGEVSVEYSEATTTQIYSPSRGDWVREILESLAIPRNILPAVVQPGTLRGSVRTEVLKECGLGGGFPVIAVASHDTASAVAAVPNMDRDSVFISSGTWSLMGVETDEPNTSDEALRLHFTNEGGVDGGILLLRNLTGLWIVQECTRQWEREGLDLSWEEIISAAAAAQPCKALIDPDAKEFQSPGNMPQAIHAYCHAMGQPSPLTIGEVARCAFESLCLKYRSVLHSLERVTGRRLQTIRVVGGGSRNSFLCQMIADSCNRLVVSGPIEASTLGNVMLQAVATGHLPGISAGRAAIADSVQCSEYTPHRSDSWDEAFTHFRNLEATQT